MVRSAGIVVAFALGVLVAPAEAEQAKRVYRIGALNRAYAANSPMVEGLKAGLNAIGLHEGRDVIFDIRFTDGNLEVMPAVAAELVNARVDLIFATGEPAALAAKAATQQIPIVFTAVGDPVAVGLVSKIARPGGNLTGVASLFTDLAPKRLEVLKALVPSLRRVWAIYYVGDSAAVAAARKAREAAPSLQLEFLDRPVRTPQDLARALKAVRPGDGILAPNGATLNIAGELRALLERVPIVWPSAFWIPYGALVSYGSDYYAEAFQAARLVAKILRGARPQDLPVEGANRIELAINLKTAKSLGLTIPHEILLRADRVIE